MKILIIEDDSGLNRGISFALGQEGYKTISAQTLQEGESLFEKEESKAESYDMSGLKDGSYEATVDGQNGEMTVQVVVEDGKIKEVNVVSNHETENIAAPALEKIPAAMVEANSPDVDGVTGATLTSGRIRAGVKACLDQAK